MWETSFVTTAAVAASAGYPLDIFTYILDRSAQGVDLVASIRGCAACMVKVPRLLAVPGSKPAVNFPTGC